MEHPKVRDARSQKIIFLSHCCLNQNAKVRGIASYPGAMTPLIELLLAHGVGIIQMPCPETTYLGSMRWGAVKEQYNNPMFRRHCATIAQGIVDQAQNYLQCGYQVLGFVMMDGSPVCGLNRTPAPRNEMWGGMTWYVPESDYVTGRGNYCEVLQAELVQRGLGDLPFVAAPEFDEVGSLETSLAKIRALLEQPV